MGGRYHSCMRWAAWVVVLAAALAPRAFGQTAGQSLPDLGSVDSVLSPQMEKRLGEAIMREIRTQDPQYVDDPEISDYLNQLGARLTGSRQDFEFFAIRENTINAFALPGGYVGVHTGLISTAETESELASVLAHEVSHVTQRHIARMVAQQQQMQMPMIAALAAAILLGRSRPDLAIGAAMGAQAAGVQAQLSYSRDFEREADRIGIQRLDDAGFDAHAMATFFERMQRSNRISEDSTMPGYFRTHPVTSERIADVQNKAATMPYRQHLDSPEFQFVRAKLRAEQGDAREAVNYFQTAAREHRYANESATRLGLAYALLRANKVSEAQAEVARIRALGASSPMVEMLDARAKRAAGDIKGATELVGRARERYPTWRAITYAYIAGLQELGKNDEAIATTREALARYPRDARVYGMQAKIYAMLGKRLLQHQAQAEVYALQGALPSAIEQLSLARAAGDGDFYQLSVIDARLKELRAQYTQELKEAKR
jgi:beta-barrel assembly-enhancing protease